MVIDTGMAGAHRMLDIIRRICRAMPGVAEDIKWGNDLVFSVGGRMFAVVCVDPPHSISFKCTAEDFGELVERPGMIPAPYLARALWVQEQALGDVLQQGELEHLIRSSYDLVVAKLPQSRKPGAHTKGRVRRKGTQRRRS